MLRNIRIVINLLEIKRIFINLKFVQHWISLPWYINTSDSLHLINTSSNYTFFIKSSFLRDILIAFLFMVNRWNNQITVLQNLNEFIFIFVKRSYTNIHDIHLLRNILDIGFGCLVFILANKVLLKKKMTVTTHFRIIY